MCFSYLARCNPHEALRWPVFYDSAIFSFGRSGAAADRLVQDVVARGHPTAATIDSYTLLIDLITSREPMDHPQMRSAVVADVRGADFMVCVCIYRALE